jgi:pyrroline-5-carboxylate reductase
MTPGKPDTSSINIALIGCGKMGGALLRGWLKAKITKHVHVLEPAGLKGFGKSVTVHKDAASFLKAKPKADVYVLAVKPQVMDDVCRSIAAVIPAGALVLSIAAGQTIASFEKRFGAKQPVVRAMPNLPASIGKGITAAVANKRASARQRRQANSVLRAAGLVEWVDKESLLDPVTALSGSGPAYVFLLIEALAESGKKAGLPADLAMTLARQTVIGAAALAGAEPAISAETLRKNVTSPGGTTEAALKILTEDGNLQALFDRAIAAASARAKQLSQ